MVKCVICGKTYPCRGPEFPYCKKERRIQGKGRKILRKRARKINYK